MKQESFAPLDFTTTVLTAQFLLVLRMLQFSFSLDAALEGRHGFGPEPYTGSDFSSGNHCCCVLSVHCESVVETKKKSL